MKEVSIQRASPESIQGVQRFYARVAHVLERKVGYGRAGLDITDGHVDFYLRCATNTRALTDGLRDATKLSDEDVVRGMGRIDVTINDLKATMPEGELKTAIVQSLMLRLDGFRFVAGLIGTDHLVAKERK